MNMKFNALCAFSIALSSGLAQAALPSEKINLDQGSGQVEFRAIGRPSAIKIVGKGSAPKGDFLVKGTKVTGSARFDLASLDTGIDMRTRHMKEKFLEIQKYPEARLTITQLTLPQSLKDGVALAGIPFNGTLLLHGVQHPVTGTAQVKQNGEQVEISAEFGLKIADYAIAQPTFAGITMADEVQVAVTSTAPASKVTAN